MKRTLPATLFILISFAANAQDITQQLDSYLSRPRKQHHFNGTALVVHKGNILLYKGYGLKNVITKKPNDTATLYRIGSLSKPFTAAVILQLVEQGALILSNHVATFFPNYPSGDSISIEQLLTHTSGVSEYLQLKSIQQLPESAPPIPIEQLIAYFSNEPLVFRPGKKFSYSNSNYILLSAIIEKITREKFEHVVRRAIFEPLSMHHSGFDFKHAPDTNKSTGHLSIQKRIVISQDFDSTYAPGCGSMYSTVMDLFRWYRGLCNGRVIKDSTRELAFMRKKDNYGYGWFIETKHERKCISHAGGVPGFLANLQFYPSDDLCIILLSNSVDRDIFIDSDRLAALIFGAR